MALPCPEETFVNRGRTPVTGRNHPFDPNRLTAQVFFPVIESDSFRVSRHSAGFVGILGLAYMMTGDYTKAIAAHEQLLERKSMLQFAYSRLAAIYAVQGNIEKARTYAADLIGTKPDFTISDWSKSLLYPPGRTFAA